MQQIKVFFVLVAVAFLDMLCCQALSVQVASSLDLSGPPSDPFITRIDDYEIKFYQYDLEETRPSNWAHKFLALAETSILAWELHLKAKPTDEVPDGLFRFPEKAPGTQFILSSRGMTFEQVEVTTRAGHSYINAWQREPVPECRISVFSEGQEVANGYWAVDIEGSLKGAKPTGLNNTAFSRRGTTIN